MSRFPSSLVGSTAVLLVASISGIGQPTSPCRSAQAEVRAGQASMDRDQNAIRRLGFEKRIEEVNDWQQLSADARSQFMSDTFDGLLAVAAKGNQWAGSLSPPTANSAISQLRAAGINIQGLNNSIRTLAATSGKPLLASGGKEFIDSISNAKAATVVGTVHDRETRLKALSDVLGVVLGALDPTDTLPLLTADLTFTTSAIYNNVTRRVSINEINRLGQLNEQDLTSLKHLSEQLKTDVNKINTAKRRMTTLCEPGAQESTTQAGTQAAAITNVPAPVPVGCETAAGSLSRDRRVGLAAAQHLLQIAETFHGDVASAQKGVDEWNAILQRDRKSLDECIANNRGKNTPK